MKTKIINSLVKAVRSKFSIVVVFYCVFAFLALRGFLLEPRTIGHNWDWSISPLSFQLKQGFTYFYGWIDASLGYARFGGHTFFNFILYNLGYLGIGGEFVSKFLLFFTIVTSGVSMFYLMADIVKHELCGKIIENHFWIFFSSILSGFSFALSPYLFNLFIGGAVTVFLSYSLMPLAIYLFRKIGRSRTIRHAIFLAIVLFMIALCVQNLFFTSLILFLYILVQKSRLRLFRNLLITYSVLFALSFSWYLPLLYNTFVAHLAPPPIPSGTLSVRLYALPSLSQVFIGTGFIDRNFFTGSVDLANKNLWLLCSYGLIVLVFTSLFLLNKKSRRRTKEILFWTILLLTSYVFATGANNPFGSIVFWMYEHIPYMNPLFRGTSHFMMPLTIFLSILIGMGIYCFLAHFRPKRIHHIYLVTLVMIIVWLSPFFTGNLGLNYLESRGAGNFVSTFQVSPGLEKILAEINNDGGVFRVLYLPAAWSPRYLATEYQQEGQGGDPVVGATPGVISDSYGNIYAGQYITLLQDTLFNKPQDFSRLLMMANCKYIILRKDAQYNFGPFVYKWNYTEVYDALRRMERIELVEEHEYESLWRNNYLPRIYPIDRLIYLPQGADSLSAIALTPAFPPESAYFWDEVVFNRWAGVQLAYQLPVDMFSYANPKQKQIADFESSSDLSGWWGDYNFRTNQSDPAYVKKGIGSLRIFNNHDAGFRGGSINLRFQEAQNWNGFGGLSLWLYYPKIPLQDSAIVMVLSGKSWFILYEGQARIEQKGWNHLVFTLHGHNLDDVRVLRLTLRDYRIGNTSLFVDDIKLEETPLLTGGQYGGVAMQVPANKTLTTNINILQSAAYSMGIEASAHDVGKLTFEIGGQEFNTLLTTSGETGWLWSNPLNLNKGNYSLSMTSDVDVIIDKIIMTSETRTTSTPTLTFRRLNPTKYEVQVKTSDPFFLAFLESYDTNWKAYINGIQLPGEDHFLINGYANAWYINKTGTYTITLEFWPQKIFTIGSAISITTLILCILYVSKDKIKTTYKQYIKKPEPNKHKRSKDLKL